MGLEAIAHASALYFLRQFLKDEIMVLIRSPNYSMW
jgi:hypothetical protein